MLLALLPVRAAGQEPVTLERVIDLARQRAPSIAAARGRVVQEAGRRFASSAPPDPEVTLGYSRGKPREGGPMLGVAIAGLAANLISMKFLHGGREKSLNVKAAYLEVVTDVMGSLGVIAAALLMRPTGWYWLDPVIFAAIGIFIVPRTISLLRQSGHILLEGSPREVDPNALRRKILSLPGVEAVHDMHLWTLTSGVNSASVHIRAAADRPREEVQISVRNLFEEHAGVDHATIQVEPTSAPECPDGERHP
jgi:cation diffusion facilitator family transporter